MEHRSAEEMTDQHIMLAVREGDVDKLGILFERYHAQLFSFLYRLTGNRQQGEDLVQEVFVRILRYRHTFRGECRFSTWLFRIARNARIDMLRQSPRDETLDIEDLTLELVSAAPTPAERAERRDEIRVILQALEKLPEEKREVLLLRGSHGLKFEEIAEVMSCSVNTIKGRAFRAIRELRAAIQQLKRERAV